MLVQFSPAACVTQSKSTFRTLHSSLRKGWMAVAVITLAVVSASVQAANITWNVSSGNWSTTTNWTPNGALLTTSNVIFGNTGSVANNTTITNTADATVTVDTLTYSINSATNWQNTDIANGVTVNVGGTTTGVMTVGINANATTKATISGLGALNVNKSGGTVQIGAAASAANQITFDMSGLSTFTANLGTTGTFRLGDPTAGPFASDITAILGKTSTITTNTFAVGDTTGNFGTDLLKLGSTANTINANSIFVGGAAAGARSSGEISFNTGTGSLKIRSANDTVNGRALLDLFNSASGTGGALTGSLLMAGHSADVRLSTMTMAARTSGVGGGAATFTFDTGLLDITSVVMSRMTAAATGTLTSTLNLGGGTTTIGAISMSTNTSTGGTADSILNVSGGANTLGAIAMAAATGAGRTSTATINITGGATTMTGAITRTAGTGTTTATINLDGGSLNMASFALGGANNITFNAKSGTLSNVSQLNAGGALNKTTTGTLTLTGTNTYTGATNVTDGKLLVNGTHSGGGLYTISAPATLGGSGSITGATVSLFGTVSPGNSAGTLSADNFNFQTGGTYEWELTNPNLTAGTGWDLLDLTGGALTFVGSGPFSLDIDTTGAILTGSYNLEIAKASSIVNFNAANFNLSVTGYPEYIWSLYQQGNSLYLLAAAPIPEPSSLIMWAMMGLGLARLRRKSAA